MVTDASDDGSVWSVTGGTVDGVNPAKSRTSGSLGKELDGSTWS